MKTGFEPAILNLAAPDSNLINSVEDALGGRVRKFPGAQIATLFPHEPIRNITECGYPNQEVPFYGWHGHLDGLWNGSAPVHQRIDRGMNES